jgi:hypothetical protein
MLAAAKFDSFREKYKNEEDCFIEIFNAKWPNGFRCPRCDHPHYYLISTRRLPLYECRSCRAQTSLIAGTFMEGSRTPVHLWFHAIFLHTQPQSINAVQLSTAISVTYKTAWLICHKIRRAMSRSDSEQKLTGIVRVSDSVYCRRLTTFFEWHRQEQPLLIGTSDNENGRIALLKIKLQSKKPLRDKYDCPDTAPFITNYVDPAAAPNVILTRRYGRNMNTTLAWMGHYVTQWIGQVFRGIGPKHLQSYLDQYCYTYNVGKEYMFSTLLADCIQTKRVTYNEIISAGEINNRSKRPQRQHQLKTLKTG